jgi:phosphoglycerate dehydrogenase-like enzyme
MVERLRCVVVGDMPPAAGRYLLDALPHVTWTELEGASADDLARADVLFVWDFRWRGLAAILPRLAALRWVHAASAGVDHLMGPHLRDRDIRLTNSTGVYEGAIAEYVLALILEHVKGLDETRRAQAARRWAYRETRSLDGLHVVIVGAGRIGTAIATLVQRLGVTVTGIRRSPRSAKDGPYREILGVDALIGVVREADFVVVATPASTSTTGLIDASVLESMPPHAMLINVGRGAAVDTEALVASLVSGAIAGAALDVFDVEPLPKASPLWDTPNLLISPHMSGDVVGWDTSVAVLFVDNATRFLDGRQLISLVEIGGP